MIQRVKEFVKRDLVDRYHFNAKIKKATPVMVYQMGKVASSSIYHPLKKIYPGLVVHTHQFNQNAWYWEVRALHKMHYAKSKMKFKVISLTREPISRNISEFFHRFAQYTGVPFEKNTFELEEIKAHFLNNIDHDFPLDWFDNNFKKHFGLDVYKKHFSTEGFDFYENDNVDLLLMHHNLDDSKKESLINEFLNTTDFKIDVRNVGEQKPYQKVYKEFKSKIKLPKEYLDKMASSKYFNHFYDAKYIADVISKWQ